MPVLDAQWDKLLDAMRHLPPIRNVNAIRTWLEHTNPDMVVLFDVVTRDAAKGVVAPKRLVLLMMMAFAAGRAYQAANPDAPRDPEGYGA